METPVETEDFFMVNLAIVLVFIFLAAVAGVVALLYGRVVYKRWFSWVRLFGGALLGGILAGGVFLFATEFHKLNSTENKSLSALNDLLMLSSWVLLPLMLIIPILSIMLRNRKAKIAELELEVAALKAQLAAKPQSPPPPPPPAAPNQNASATTK
ncbi:MAG: hypothetical protein MUC87_14155 [Bacteroidia bacterium]|jgi:hypothetical protein|nr:hypothetical protein [Bacteroidia bacterium]